MDFLALGERKVTTARLLCDVSRNHAASLTEPLLAGLLAKARTLPRFISEKALTNQQPELAEDSASRKLGHRSTPLLQRCCDDSLNRSCFKASDYYMNYYMRRPQVTGHGAGRSAACSPPSPIRRPARRR